MNIISKLDEIEQSYIELEKKLSSPDAFSDKDKYKELAKSHAELEEIVRTYRDYKAALEELAENKELVKDSDPEIRELAKSEIESLEEKKFRHWKID